MYIYILNTHALINDTCIARTLIIQIHKLGELDWLGRYICFDSRYCLTFLGKLEILRSLRS